MRCSGWIGSQGRGFVRLVQEAHTRRIGWAKDASMDFVEYLYWCRFRFLGGGNCTVTSFFNSTCCVRV
jgi:hypothetical protein